jgi:DNA invertase Pin-like site-specific DNA recombinase
MCRRRLGSSELPLRLLDWKWCLLLLRLIPRRSPRPSALHQQGIDTTTPAGKAMFQMMGVFAEFERSMIVERVRAGVGRAKASGTKSGKAFGRPRVAAETEQQSVRRWRLLGAPASTRSPRNLALLRAQCSGSLASKRDCGSAP